jgi:hypothetical protein
MKQLEVWRRKQQLEHLFKQIAKLKGDDELVAHWSRYLCVLVCGFIEVAVFEIYSEFARDKAQGFVANYVQKQLSRFQNPKMEKILTLAGSFNGLWRDKLKKATDGELKDAVDSIVNNRNNIAHGRNSDITYGRIKEYFEKAVKVIDVLEDLCYQ